MSAVGSGFVGVWNALIPDKMWSRNGLGRLLGGMSYILAVDLVRLLLFSWWM